ncbi:MAG: hypothetical protein COB60_04600 [Flavobacteriaceae bacterium]|nr:MAG: hypothetical protein COB60_04600 [Flavobacteriaceae bacterium]
MKKLLFLFVCTLILSSCGAKKIAQASKEPSREEKLTRIFKKYEKSPYVYGGTTIRGFDCSGFVQRVYLDAFKLSIPRTTKVLIKTGKKVKKNQFQPGDLLFFKPSKKYFHVGIYSGNQYFIHSSSSYGVSKTQLENPYWKKHFLYARRILTSK